MTGVFVDFLAAGHLPEEILCTLFFKMRMCFSRVGITEKENYFETRSDSYTRLRNGSFSRRRLRQESEQGSATTATANSVG